MNVCKRCFISGRVQGVFYRASAAEEARRLSITGYAKNLTDGRVEVLACGEEGSVKQFCDWLSQGPPNATVSGVEMIDVVCEQIPATFATK